MPRIIAIFTLFACISIAAADPCKSGPQPDQRAGPYSALVCVGKERGMSHCYVCESASKPVVIVFARTLSDPLGKLVKQLDGAVKEHKAAELRAWVTVPGRRSDEDRSAVGEVGREARDRPALRRLRGYGRPAGVSLGQGRRRDGAAARSSKKSSPTSRFAPASWTMRPLRRS